MDRWHSFKENQMFASLNMKKLFPILYLPLCTVSVIFYLTATVKFFSFLFCLLSGFVCFCLYWNHLTIEPPKPASKIHILMRCELLAWGFLVPANRGSGTGGGFICAACTLVKFYERSTVIRKQSSWIQLNYSTHAEGNFITSWGKQVYTTWRIRFSSSFP